MPLANPTELRIPKNAKLPDLGQSQPSNSSSAEESQDENTRVYSRDALEQISQTDSGSSVQISGTPDTIQIDPTHATLDHPIGGPSAEREIDTEIRVRTVRPRKRKTARWRLLITATVTVALLVGLAFMAPKLMREFGLKAPDLNRFKTWLVSLNTSETLAPAPAPAPVSVRAITVSVVVYPSEARVVLDGHAVTNPLETYRPPDERIHTLHAEAPGYHPLNRSVSFKNDLMLVLALEPNETPAPAAIPAPSAP